MHSEKYYRSKIPLHLVFLFLANLILVIALEVLLVYRYPAQLDAETLASFDSAYEGCTISASDDAGGMHMYLAKTKDGDLHLIPVIRHSIFFDRARIHKNQITVIPAEAEMTEVTVKKGLHSSTATVNRFALSDTVTYSVQITGAYSQTSRELSTYYIAIAAVLELLELFVYHKVKGTE